MLSNQMRNFSTKDARSLLARRVSTVALVSLSLGACQNSLTSTAVGPSRSAIMKAGVEQQIPGVKVVPITIAVAQQAEGSVAPNGSFAATLGDAVPIGTVVGVGDVIDLTIWEAPPALLFGSTPMSTRIDVQAQIGRPEVLSGLVVGPSGSVSVPFAGQIPAAGRTLRQIEQTIVSRLYRKANKPQVLARVARNTTANVSIVGDVKTAGRVPLTPRGERLLDVIAQAGGTTQSVDRMTVQVTRGTRTVRMAMQDVVRNAQENIVLQQDDIITALFQPYTFTVLGAAGKNEEVRFEGTGLNLSQALGRVGGLQDNRADPRGVFIFRWTPAVAENGAIVAQGSPTIYQADLKNPQTLFAAQQFEMRDGDVMFVSNSPAADFQRFVGILSSTVLPAVSLRNSLSIP